MNPRDTGLDIMTGIEGGMISVVAIERQGLFASGTIDRSYNFDAGLTRAGRGKEREDGTISR